MDPQAVHAGPPPASGIASDPARSSSWHRWTAVALLIAINHFNYIDRQILAAVEPEIRKELFPAAGEAAASDAKFWMGLLPFAFLITYMFLAPLFGMLADRYSRWKIVGVGVILWSIASGASGWVWGLGLAAAYWALFATRCFVGVGEGAYGPAAPAMIADLFPVERRGMMLSYFYLAIPVGGALGYAFGELVMLGFGWSWRWAFYLVVPPGILLGVLCFLMREPPRGLSEHAMPATSKGFDKYLLLLKIPSFVYNTLGMTAMSFAIGGLAFWMPDYLERHHVEALFGIPPRTAFGGIVALSGLLATLAGGWLADKLRGRFRGSYFLVSGAAMALGFPAVLGFLYAPFPLAWIFVFLAVFCLFFNTGPTNTILANVTHPSVRSSGFALNILVMHLFGDAVSPALMGLCDGRLFPDAGFHLVAWTILIGGILWLLGAPHLDRDTELAATRG
ncbi:MAG TPA: MFS transporter [Gemmataceae bacterium]|jgi:MFS family permease|nr:MFS transporter [Gemmataceae bacterium]